MFPCASKVWKVKFTERVSGGFITTIAKTTPPMPEKKKLFVVTVLEAELYEQIGELEVRVNA
jgi:hypothetical protein